MTFPRCRTLIALPVLALAACGGGGGDAPPEVVINLPPTFTSASAVSVAENTDGVFYTAQASDPEGRRIRFLLSADGADSTLFDLDTLTGELSFLDPPDFENPADADADNVYEVQITAQDGFDGTATLLLSVTVTDVAQAVSFKSVGTGFSRPVFLTGLGDGTPRVLVFEQGGAIRVLDPDTQTTETVPFLDLSGTLSGGNEQGLLGGALAPDFATSRQIYLNVTNAAGDTEIRRYRLISGRSDMADPATEDLILRIAQPRTNHNAGWIGFADDGTLIVPTGDGGGSGDPDEAAQNPQSLLGKILRINVSGDDFPTDDTRDYAIPSGNAFADAADGLPEIFALGLRNPFRASFDPSGDLLIGDVGQEEREEISRLSFSAPGTNFGWDVIEGTRPFEGSTSATLTAPVIELSHGTGAADSTSITGGYIYDGPVAESVQGRYVFGDLNGKVFSVDAGALDGSATLDGGDISVETEDWFPDGFGLLSSFGTDDAGHLYALSLSGTVYRLEAED